VEVSSREDPGFDQSANGGGRPWGIWCTLLFSGIISILHIVVGFFAALGFSGIELNPKVNGEEHLRSLQANGLYLSVATISSTIICSALILLFAKLRRGTTISEYLRFKPVSAAQLLKWLFLVGLFIVASDATTLVLGRPLVPKFMSEAYATAGSLPLLWLALVIAAPLFEELFFRGFLFAGLVSSRLGASGTIVITAFVWGVIHLQYEAVDIFMVCILGLILGLARLKTDSVYTPIALHSFANLVATIETSLFGTTST